jgi:hypothetical protein
MSEVKLVAITIVICVAMIVGGMTISTIHSNQMSAEIQKVKAAEGHKFKFGKTEDKEVYDEVK